MLTKTCACCKETLPAKRFVKSRQAKNGLHSYCRLCHNAKTRAWERTHKRDRNWKVLYTPENREKRRFWQLRRKGVLDFGVKEFEALRRKQNGVCAICLKASRLVVDHDHKNGVVQCNRGLGYFSEDVQAFYRAAEYLTDSQRTAIGETLEIPVLMTGK